MTILYCIALFTSWLLMTALLSHDISKGTKRIMALQDDLNAAVASLKAKDDQIIALVTSQGTTIASLNAAVTALQAQLQQTGAIDPAAVQGAIDALNAEAARVAAATIPAVPAASVTP